MAVVMETGRSMPGKRSTSKPDALAVLQVENEGEFLRSQAIRRTGRLRFVIRCAGQSKGSECPQYFGQRPRGRARWRAAPGHQQSLEAGGLQAS